MNRKSYNTLAKNQNIKMHPDSIKIYLKDIIKQKIMLSNSVKLENKKIQFKTLILFTQQCLSIIKNNNNRNRNAYKYYIDLPSTSRN
jgi:hypothetical protein